MMTDKNSEFEMTEIREPEFSTENSTGSLNTISFSEKLIAVPFGKFEVVLRLTPEDKFLGIEEIRINKRFISVKQYSRTGFHDVEDFYK